MKVDRRTTLSNIAVALGFVAATTGCMQDATKPPSTDLQKSSDALESAVIENIATTVIVAAYQNLRSETQALALAAEKLRLDPSAQNLAQAQSKWKEARIPWESTEGFLFGPVSSLGIDPSIDSWPLSKIDLDKILRDQPDISAAFVRSLGTDVQGFHTAEYLLFGDGIVSGTKTIQEMTRPQLNYLAAVTTVLAEQTAKLYSAWVERHDPSIPNSPPYIDLVRKPGRENPFYPSKSAILQQYVRGMMKIAAEVGKGKIAGPMGDNPSAADASLVESQFSWNSLDDFQNNVRSLRNLYTGDYIGTGPGLDEIVKLKNPTLNARMLLEIDAAEFAIRAIAGNEGLSFTKAIKDEPARARGRNAISALAKLEATLESELLPLFSSPN